MRPAKVEVTVVQPDIESDVDIVGHPYWQGGCRIGEYGACGHIDLVFRGRNRISFCDLRGALLGYCASDLDGRLSGGRLDGVEQRLVHVVPLEEGLDVAGAVTQH